MEEIWKDIVGYEGYYQISSHGRVKSLSRVCNSNKKIHKNRILAEKILIPNVQKKGYFRILLQKDGVRKRFMVAVLVARAFIPNPENKPFVDHIDNDKSNNTIQNLRWVTAKENSNNPISIERRKAMMKGKFWARDLHGWEHLKGAFVKSSRKVVRINPQTNEVFHYSYIREAEKDGYKSQMVSLCCRHKYKRYLGQIFMYESEYLERVENNIPLV